VGREVVPDNIVAAAVNMNILGVITFSLMFGVALASMGEACPCIACGMGGLWPQSAPGALASMGESSLLLTTNGGVGGHGR
jgi:hypothetical protein